MGQEGRQRARAPARFAILVLVTLIAVPAITLFLTLSRLCRSAASALNSPCPFQPPSPVDPPLDSARSEQDLPPSRRACRAPVQVHGPPPTLQTIRLRELPQKQMLCYHTRIPPSTCPLRNPPLPLCYIRDVRSRTGDVKSSIIL